MMATDRDNWSDVGCLLLLAVWVIGGLIIKIIDAVKSLLETAVEAFFLIVATCGVVLLIVTIADAFRHFWNRGELRKRRRQAMRSSQFPRFAYRFDTRQIDSLLWEMIVQYLRAPRLRHKGQEVGQVEHKLRRDQEFFNWWRHEHIVDVLEEPYNRDLLVPVYNRFHGLLRRWCREEEDLSPLAHAIFAKIASESSSPRWLLLPAVVFFFSAKKIDFRAEVESLEMRLDSYLVSAERFRKFLDQYFFEIVPEASAYEMGFGAAFRRHGIQQPPMQLIQRVSAQIPEILEDHEEKEHQERLKREEQALQERNARGEAESVERRAEYERAAEAKQTEELKRLYLAGVSLEAIFEQLQQGQSGFEEDLKVVGDAKFQALSQRSEFFEFWQQYGYLVLRAHHQRIQSERRAEQVEAIISDILTLHRSEQEYIRRGEFVKTDPKLGYLLARARQNVRRRMPEASFEDFENYLPRELHSLVEGDREVYRFENRRIQDCNVFRAGSLFYSDIVVAEEYQPEDNRDELVCAFVEKSKQWREQYWKQSYEDYRAERHPRQKEIADFLRDEPVTSFEELERYLPSLERMFRAMDKKSQEI